MKGRGLKIDGRKGKGKSVPIANPQTSLDRAHICIDIECSGGWMAAEQLRDAALVALESGGNVIANLANVDHLDASALQILLALDSEQKRRGQNLELIHASAEMRQWFQYAGVIDHFTLAEPSSNE